MFKKVVAFLCLFFVSFAFSFAANEIQLDEAGENFLKISWEDAEDAAGYRVLYSSKPFSEGQPEAEDPIIEKNFIIPGLLSETKYYVQVIGLTGDAGEQYKTAETEFVTGKKGATKAERFRVVTAQMNAKNKVEVSFSNDIDFSYDDISFTVENLDDADIYYNVANFERSEESPKKIILIFDDTIPSGVTYKVGVESIKDIFGNVIRNGVDSEVTFIGEDIADPSEPIVEPVEKEPEAECGNGKKEAGEECDGGDTCDAECNIKDLQAGGPEPVIEELQGGPGEGPVENLVAEEGVKEEPVEPEAVTENLPDTGPEHILLIVLALILGGAVYLVQRKS